MSKTRSSRTECAKCPLQECEGLRALDPKQIAFMQGFKQGEMAVDKGTQVLVQGAISPHLYTVLEGVLMRFRLLEDGRRQTVNFMFPGDLLGLQGAMDDPLTHGAEALTDATLCVFSRDRLIELYRDAPRLGFDVTWLAAKEEAALEEHLVSLGQRNAKERIVCLALILMRRGIETGVAKGGKLALGITQAQIADMLGLSLVHTNRTLQSLRRSGLVAWSLTEIAIPDLDAAEAYAALDPALSGGRPFI